MNEILSFSGQLPEHFDAAFAEIGPELGFARAGQGGLSVAPVSYTHLFRNIVLFFRRCSLCAWRCCILIL